jgi:hypothetical protein
MTFLRVIGFGLLVAAPIVACSEGGADKDPTDSASSAAVTDILTMTRRDDGRFDVVCRDQTRETVTAEDIRADRVCRGGGGGGGGGTGTRLGIIYGRSDSCDSATAIVTVRESTDCLSLSATQEAWSISVNGQCQNISDTNVRQACLAMKPGGTIIYGRSDSCDASLAVAQVTNDTDCLTLSATQEAWSISVDGRCQNISDTNIRQACLTLQPRGTFIYGRSDSCDASLAVARVTQDTDCLALSASQEAWSVSVDGQCRNISDTNLRAACIALQN